MLNAILYKGLGSTDPYQQHILTDASTGSKYLLLSDGSITWQIGGNDGASSRQSNPFGTRTVAEVLNNWLTQNYRHGLVNGSEPDYDARHGGFIEQRSDSSGRGTITYIGDKNKSAAYAEALLNGKVITLTQVLKSVNPTTHVFYVPIGYYYGGDIPYAPSVSDNDASDASNRAGYSNNNTFAFTSPTQQKKEEKDDSTMLFLLLPLAALFAAKYF